MRRLPLVCLAAALAMAAAASAMAADANVADLVKEFRGQAEPKQRTPEELQAAYAAVLAQLLPDMSGQDLGKQGGAQATLEDITFRAGRPGADAERLALSKAIAAALPATSTPLAKTWLVRQLQYVGRAECVPALSALLADTGEQVAESARRALQRNSSEEAGAALRQGLAKAQTPEHRVAFINAVAGRGDAKAVPALAKCLTDTDEPVGLAAAAGLGKIGGAEAMAALNKARPSAKGRFQTAVLDSCLMAAGKLAAEGKTDEAFTIFSSLNESTNPDHVRMAGLRGMVMSRGEKAVDILSGALTGKDAPLRAFALSLVCDVPGAAATKAFVDILPKLAPAEQAAMLVELGARGDAAAKPAVLEGLKSDDADIRAAAARAIGDLGGAADAALLGRMAAAGQGEEKKTIFQSLVALRGNDVDEAIIAALGKETPAVRGELIRALAARRAKDATAALVTAAGDADGAVRVEAAKALGAIGTAPALPALAGLLTAADQAERDAAQKAISDIAGRTEDKETCAAPLLAALAKATGAARDSLLGVLPQAGTAKALEAVRGALRGSDDAAREAAIRALAQWPDAGPAADLLAVAKTDVKATRQVLALRGYVRLTGLAECPPAEKVRMYQDALAAAKRAEEKKMVLGAMAEAPSLATLQISRSLMASADLKAEAAMATVKIAAGIGGGYAEEAKAALKAVLAGSSDDNVKKQAQEAINVFERFEDYIMGWLASGPYTASDKDGPGLFDVVFPPEQGDGAKAKWKPAAPGPGDQPWRIDLARIFEGGDNVCGYLRTFLRSDKAQDAQLEIGTDDGVKVWLNGKVVHANNATRGLTPGADKVKVSLKEGWNVLLLKVTQGGGQWEACARIRAADGGKPEGIGARPAPEGN